jgi:hypothetical protein
VRASGASQSSLIADIIFAMMAQPSMVMRYSYMSMIKARVATVLEYQIKDCTEDGAGLWTVFLSAWDIK